MSSKRAKIYSASYVKPICFDVTGMVQTADHLSQAWWGLVVHNSQ